MVSDISEARYRQKAGEPLETRHIEAIRKHDSKYANRKVSVHVSAHTVEEWKADAAARGYSLSTFIWMRVEQTRTPDPKIVQLEEEKSRLEAEVEVLRRLLASMSGQTTKIERQLFELQHKMADALGAASAGKPQSG